MFWVVKKQSCPTFDFSSVIIHVDTTCVATGPSSVGVLLLQTFWCCPMMSSRGAPTRAGLTSIGALGKQQKWGPPCSQRYICSEAPVLRGPQTFRIYYAKWFFGCLKVCLKANGGPNISELHGPEPPMKLVIHHWNHLSSKTNSTGPIGNFNCEVPLYTYRGQLEFFFLKNLIFF